MEPRKWELMCENPFGACPKPLCHLVTWDTWYPKRKKKGKIRDRTGFVSKSLLYSQEALGKLRPTFQSTSIMESGFSYISQRMQTWLFLECPGAALFIIARTWKQPRCPSADEWIRKLWYIYTMEYYSAIKKNPFESVLMRWMKLESIIQSEVSRKDKHQYSILMHIYGI